MSKLKAIYLSCALSSGYSGLETFALGICSNKEQSSSTIMLFTRRNVVLCLSMVLTAASLASVVETTTSTKSIDSEYFRCGEPGWYEYDGACYKFFDSLLNFREADENCISIGCQLVSIHSQEEMSMVKSLIPGWYMVRISLETRSVLS